MRDDSAVLVVLDGGCAVEDDGNTKVPSWWVAANEILDIDHEVRVVHGLDASRYRTTILRYFKQFFFFLSMP